MPMIYIEDATRGTQARKGQTHEHHTSRMETTGENASSHVEDDVMLLEAKNQAKLLLLRMHARGQRRLLQQHNVSLEDADNRLREFTRDWSEPERVDVEALIAERKIA